MNIALALVFLFYISSSFSMLPLSSKKLSNFSLYAKKNKIKSIEHFYTPKSGNQEKYVKILNEPTVDIVISVGPAGTGKTMFACLRAIELLKTGVLNKIILTRPIVTVEEELGFLPGNINKKMDPWTRPIFDIFLEHYSKSEFDEMIHNNVIEISPLAYMRGRTFKNAFIIADEMQNSSPNQMMMLTTRIGKNSKLVITGDLKQTDKLVNNGLIDFVEKINCFNNFTPNKKDSNKIEIIEFINEDVERSSIVKKVLDIYNFKKSAVINKTADDIIPVINLNNTAVTNINSNSILPSKNKKSFITGKSDDAALIPKCHETNFKKIWEE
jgi:phosphate starvation-inducible PhoH-like protein